MTQGVNITFKRQPFDLVVNSRGYKSRSSPLTLKIVDLAFSFNLMPTYQVQSVTAEGQMWQKLDKMPFALDSFELQFNKPDCSDLKT